MTQDGALSARFSSADTGWQTAAGADASDLAVWTLTRRGDVLTASCNGSRIGTTAGASRTTLNAGVIMAMRENANKMSGLLCEVMVFDSALSENRHAQLWRYLRGRYDIHDAKE